MQTIILAAGKGSRLRPLTDSVPKPLVEVNGIPLIINALDVVCQYPDMERVVIVVGYEAKLLQSRIGDSYNGVEIVYVHNELYSQTNNIYSLWLTRELWDRDSVLLECDIFFEKALMDQILRARGENIVLVDRFEPHMDGTVVTINDQSKICRIITSSEQERGFDFSDKFKTVNIYSFTQEFLETLFRPTIELYISTQRATQYYEIILAVLVLMGSEQLTAQIASPNKWIEIDDFSDLERAEMIFSEKPQLLERIRSQYGGYWRYDFTDFEYLYNPYFPPLQLMNELTMNLHDLLINYPSGQAEINRSLANWAMVSPDYLAVANGGSELINSLATRFKKLVMPVPAFAEYTRQLDPKQIIPVTPDPDTLAHNPDDIIMAARQNGANSVVLVNPNNPSGVRFTRDQIRYMLQKLSDVEYFVLDESFADFISLDEDITLLPELAAHPNLVILRSLSKDLGVPGIRLGYVASSNSTLITEIRKALPIWHINSLAQYFLNILPKYRCDYQHSREMLLEARDEMYAKLDCIDGLKVIPSHANYFCCRLPSRMSARKLQEELFIEHDLLIKDLGTKDGLEPNRWIRIAVKTPAENNLLVSALEKCLEGQADSYQDSRLQLAERQGALHANVLDQQMA